MEKLRISLVKRKGRGWNGTGGEISEKHEMEKCE